MRRRAASVHASAFVTDGLPCGPRRDPGWGSRNMPKRWCGAGAGRSLLPRDWACDVAATYVTLRLEAVERHTGVRLVDPALPLLPRVAWHERSDPGAELLSWLTR